MWKCIMCETNNADDSGVCFICHTTKAVTNKYREKQKNPSRPYDCDIREPEQLSHPPRLSEPVKKVIPRYTDDERTDSTEASKKDKMIKIVNTCSKTEKIFMINLMLIAVIVFSLISIIDKEKYYTLQLFTNFLFIIIPACLVTYLTIKRIKILNVNKTFAFFIKLIVWITFYALILLINIILSIILVFTTINFM